MFRVLAASSVAVVALAGCGGGSSHPKASTSSSPAAKSHIKVGLALPGSIDDAGFDQGHYEGVKEAAAKYGFTFTYQDNLNTPEQITDALRNLAATSNIVIAAGGQFVGPLTSIAAQYPKVQFIVTAGFAQGKNIHSVVKNWAEQSYVAGVIAAKTTKVKKVGFIGGLEIPPTQQAQAGFVAGVKATDPAVQVSTTTIGTFNDPTKAKEATSAQIAAGDDVIQGFVDAAEPGVTTAVKDSGKNVAIVAGGHEAAECKLSNQIVLVTPAQTKDQVLQALASYFNGSLGPVVSVSLSTLTPEDLKASVQLCPGHSDTQLQSLIDTTVQGIVNGSIKVPTGTK